MSDLPEKPFHLHAGKASNKQFNTPCAWLEKKLQLFYIILLVTRGWHLDEEKPAAAQI